MRPLQCAQDSPVLWSETAQLTGRNDCLLPSLQPGPDGKLNEEPQLPVRPIFPLGQKRARHTLGGSALENLKEKVFLADNMMVQGRLLDSRLTGQHLARHFLKSMLVDKLDRGILYGGKRAGSFYGS